jgi:hypothetical protein
MGHTRVSQIPKSASEIVAATLGEAEQSRARRSFLAGVALLVTFGGCEQSRPAGNGSASPTHHDGPASIAPASARIGGDGIAEYRKTIAQFLAEARGAATLFAENPTLFEAEKKDRLIKSLHGRLREVPPGFDRTGRVARGLEEIMRAVGRGPLWIEHAGDLHFREETRGAKRIGLEKLPHLAQEIRTLADEVEALIGK